MPSTPISIDISNDALAIVRDDRLAGITATLDVTLDIAQGTTYTVLA